ncbi:MAG: hypothetical protein J6K05_06725 [Bacteroidaceae bacterium]|jgi:hypothetical protein|nr:hypothetical protein [Bacteroidaceae bacterium]
MEEQRIDRINEVIEETQHGGSMQDLVFNPVTGEFEQRPHGTHGAGEVVTDMTKDGFAF